MKENKRSSIFSILGLCVLNCLFKHSLKTQILLCRGETFSGGTAACPDSCGDIVHCHCTVCGWCSLPAERSLLSFVLCQIEILLPVVRSITPKYCKVSMPWICQRSVEYCFIGHRCVDTYGRLVQIHMYRLMQSTTLQILKSFILTLDAANRAVSNTRQVE